MHEGWRLVPERYDDGGLSGASLDRPALQTLLADVRAGKVNAVVVSGHVAYAVLRFGGFLGIGQKHLPVRWARLTYDPTLAAYRIDLTEEELSRASDMDFDWGDRYPGIDGSMNPYRFF